MSTRPTVLPSPSIPLPEGEGSVARDSLAETGWD
jgi:hypothetical protein